MSVWDQIKINPTPKTGRVLDEPDPDRTSLVGSPVRACGVVRVPDARMRHQARERLG